MYWDKTCCCAIHLMLSQIKYLHTRTQNTPTKLNTFCTFTWIDELSVLSLSLLRFALHIHFTLFALVPVRCFCHTLIRLRVRLKPITVENPSHTNDFPVHVIICSTGLSKNAILILQHDGVRCSNSIMDCKTHLEGPLMNRYLGKFRKELWHYHR